MKFVIGAVLLVSLVNGASLYSGGSLNGVKGSQGGNVSVDAKIKGFKAVLYLFAPDSWINAWNAIPVDGQTCFIQEASDPANADVFISDDIQKIKQQLQSECQTGSTEIGNFIDASEQTFTSLPATFLADSKAWATQAQALGEQLKQSAGNGISVQQKMGSDVYKQTIVQFSNITAALTGKIAAYSAADRQQIATAFPKLQPFISGDHAVEFLNEVTALYQTLGAGSLNASSLKTQALQIKPTLQAIWQEYKTENADGLKQAGLLLGKDLTQADAMFNTQAGASVNPGNFQMGNQGGSPVVPQIGNQGVSQSNSQISNALSQGIQQGKENLNAGSEQFKQWVQTAKQNTQDGLQEVKEKASQGVQQVKEKLNDLNQQHLQNGQPSSNGQASINGQPSLNGQSSINGNNAAAGFSVN